MELKFTKMQGIGSDYIYINCFENEISDPSALAIKLSDRHFGIGGDGIVLIYKSKIADAKMRMFNLDGSESKMCGNAIRCVAKYLYDNKMTAEEEISVDTLSGIKHIKIEADGLVKSARVNMGQAELDPEKIPVALGVSRIINQRVDIEGNLYAITCVSMGNPHCVVFFNDISELDLAVIGPKFENSPLFPERVNTEFVRIIDECTIEMRVWERGSGETLACGTGACAAAVASVLTGHCRRGEDITVKLLGGDLVINYSDESVFMSGPCETVFSGTVIV